MHICINRGITVSTAIFLAVQAHLSHFSSSYAWLATLAKGSGLNTLTIYCVSQPSLHITGTSRTDFTAILMQIPDKPLKVTLERAAQPSLKPAFAPLHA